MGKKKHLWGSRIQRMPKRINAYKQSILKNGETLKLGDRVYRYVTQPSQRLTRKHGKLWEWLRDDKGVKTGETIQHMRYSVSMVRV